MNQRFQSLDAFRGATVAFMILVNNAGNWDFIYSPLEHATWHGCTPTDLVFPFFLFAVGNSMAFVMPKLESAGQSVFLRKIFARSLIIFSIGLFLNWFPFVRWDEDHLVFRSWVDSSRPDHGVRILGVLQRIALCYLFSSLIIYYFKIRGAFVISVILLLAYWVLCFSLGNPVAPYSLSGYFGTAIDKTILGEAHLYRGEQIAFDPEGLASTLPAIAQVIFGYLTGHYILQKGKTYEMLSRLLISGCVLVFLGFCWDTVFPINKKIWTSSFVVYTSGLAMLVLGVTIDFVEFRNMKGFWIRGFTTFGKNPLFIFFLSGFIPRLLALIRWREGTGEDGEPVYMTPLPWFYEHLCRPISDNLKNGSLLFAICMVALFWLIALWVDKRRIYIRV